MAGDAQGGVGSSTPSCSNIPTDSTEKEAPSNEGSGALLTGDAQGGVGSSTPACFIPSVAAEKTTSSSDRADREVRWHDLKVDVTVGRPWVATLEKLMVLPKSFKPIIMLDDPSAPMFKEGDDRPWMSFSMPVVNDLKEFHKCSAIFQVFGKQVDFEQFRGWLIRSWKPKGEFQISSLVGGLIFVRFASATDTVVPTEQGPWFFDNQLVISRRWTPESDIRRAALTTTPIWITMPKVGQHWTRRAISIIACGVGTPKVIDFLTRGKFAGAAHVCAEVKVDSYHLPSMW